MAVIPLHVVDAFTDRPFGGNPAVIIPNAASLSEQEMIAIAEELGLEVGFVLPPEGREADVRLRFFVDRREDSLSGHVLLAAFTSLVDRGIFRPAVDGRTLLVETLAGMLEVRLTGESPHRVRIACQMPRPRFGEPVPVDQVAAVLGVPSELLRLGGRGPQRVSCGFDKLVVPVAERTIIRGSLPSLSGVRDLLDRLAVASLVMFCPETTAEEADFHCRFLHPEDRRAEDIASGTCLAAVGAFVAQHRLLLPSPANEMRMITEQGHALGRPTLAEILVKLQDGEIERVELSGTGAVVLRGSLQFNRLGQNVLTGLEARG